MQTRSTKYLITGITVSLLSVLFIGQFYDPEDGDRSFFIKHRPTFKQYFYSPAYFHRLRPQELSSKEVSEEIAFQEFRKDMMNRQRELLPYLLIQICLTFLSASVCFFVFKRTFDLLQLLCQFGVTIVFTCVLLFYIVWTNNVITSCVTSFIIAGINLLVFVAIDKIKYRLTIYHSSKRR